MMLPEGHYELLYKGLIENLTFDKKKTNHKILLEALIRENFEKAEEFDDKKVFVESKVVNEDVYRNQLSSF